MLSAQTLVTFVAAAFVMVVIPGPTVLLTIGRAMALGRLGGFLSILGTALGSIVLVVGVALGVGTVVAQSIVLFTVVKVLGAIVVAIGVACDALWVLLASSARAWFGRSPRRIEALSATGGGLMIALGAFLLIWSEKPASA